MRAGPRACTAHPDLCLCETQFGNSSFQHVWAAQTCWKLELPNGSLWRSGDLSCVDISILALMRSMPNAREREKSHVCAALTASVP